MAKTFNGEILFNYGYNIETQKPLDCRSVVDSVSDLTNTLGIFVYEGMLVYVKSEGKYYSYKQTTSNVYAWEELATGGSSSGVVKSITRGYHTFTPDANGVADLGKDVLVDGGYSVRSANSSVPFEVCSNSNTESLIQFRDNNNINIFGYLGCKLINNVAKPVFGTTSASGTLKELALKTDIPSSYSGTYIPMPLGGTYTNYSGNVTGAIKIKLPVLYTSDMLGFWVDITNYTDPTSSNNYTDISNSNSSVSYYISGWNSGYSNSWGGVTAYCLGGGTLAGLKVRFGDDGTNCCIIIGETTTNWYFPQIVVRDFNQGDFRDEGFKTAFLKNWGVSIIQTLPSNISVTITAQTSTGGGSSVSSLDDVPDGSTRKLANYLPLAGGTMSGLLTTPSLNISGGRVSGSGDDEGIVVGFASNNFAGVCLGNPTGLRSVFYLNSSNTKALWRYNNGTTSYDIEHPKKAGTIALTSDIPSVPTKVSDLTNDSGFTTNTGTITKVGNTTSGAATVSNANPTATWGGTVTIGSVGGVSLSFKMPANPNSNTWRPIVVTGSAPSSYTTDTLYLITN